MCPMEEKGKEKAAANAEAKGGGRKAGAAAARPKAAPPQAGREARRATAASGQASRGRAARRQCASRDGTERGRKRRRATALQGFRCRPHFAGSPASLRSAGSPAQQGRPFSPSTRRPAIACGLSPCLHCPAVTQPPCCPFSAPAGAVAQRASLPACLPRAAAAPAFRPPNKYANIRICKFAFIDINVCIYRCRYLHLYLYL